MSDITEEDVMKYCQSRNLMLVTKESLEYMHRPIVIENAPTVKAIPIEWLKRYEITKGQEVRLQDAINEWEEENEAN